LILQILFKYMDNSYIIYLDMDGVIVDLRSGAFKSYQPRTPIYKNPVALKLPLSNDQIRQSIHFWENLEWIHGGKELWETASTLFEHVCILSSSGAYDDIQRGKAVEAGKRLWVKKNIPSLSQKNVFIVKQKGFKKNYAAKNAILIDDVPVTITEFNKNGGYGILHDSRYYRDTIKELEDLAQPITFAEIIKHINH